MKRKKKAAWLYLTSALILIGLIIVFPILYTGYISLTNMNLFHWNNYSFVGLENYKRALAKADSGFLASIGVTLLWTLVNMVLQVVIAYFIALGLIVVKKFCDFKYWNNDNCYGICNYGSICGFSVSF